MIDPRTPCVIGVAARTWHPGDVGTEGAPEPLQMWEEVARAAAAGATRPALLEQLQSLQVVFCQTWQYDDAVANHAHRDVQEVRSQRVLRRRQMFHHADERRPLVIGAVQVEPLFLRHAPSRRCVDGRENAAVHGDQVRRENHLDGLAGHVGQRLLDLRVSRCVGQAVIQYSYHHVVDRPKRASIHGVISRSLPQCDARFQIVAYCVVLM